MLTIRKGSNATKGNVEMSTLFPDCHRSPHSNGHLNQCHRRSSPVLVTVYKHRAIQRSEGVAFGVIIAVDLSTPRRDGTVDCVRRIGSIIRSNEEFVRGPSS